MGNRGGGTDGDIHIDSIHKSNHQIGLGVGWGGRSRIKDREIKGRDMSRRGVSGMDMSRIGGRG